MRWNIKQTGLMFFAVTLLISCGGGGGGSSASTTPAATAKNVAKATNGSTISSTYSGNESFVTDGDTTTTNFWVGGASGDEVKIAFDKIYAVSEITVYTNNTSFVLTNGGSVTTSGIRVLLSSDDTTYSEVGISLGSKKDLSCFSSSIGSGKIYCSFSSNINARYIKVIVTSDFAATNLYEVQVTGV